MAGIKFVNCMLILKLFFSFGTQNNFVIKVSVVFVFGQIFFFLVDLTKKSISDKPYV